MLPAALIAAAIGACTPKPREPGTCANPEIVKGPYVNGLTETGVTIRWDADEPGCSTVTLLDGAILADPGASERVIKRQAGTATSHVLKTEYDIGQEDVPPDLPGEVFLHEVTLTDLEPGTCYGYRIETAGEDDVHRFCTAKPAGETLRIAVIGDTVAVPTVEEMGAIQELTPFIAKENPDFIIHTGDMQYYTSIVESWASWAKAMQPFFSIGAVMTTVGNHEHENDHEFEDYYMRLFAPPGEDAKSWYTYSVGGVHFFVLDTEVESQADFDPETATESRLGAEQEKWLIEALEAAVAQDDFRFSVFQFHRPIYTLGRHRPQTRLREYLAPLYEKYNVRLNLVGHVHGYERFEIDQVLNLTTGGGGALRYELESRMEEYPEDAARRKAYAREYHFTMLEIGDDAVNGYAVGIDGEVLDEFTWPVK